MATTYAPLGEEFRDDVRKKLPLDALAVLTRIKPMRSTLAVAHTFAMLALVISLPVTYWSWWAAAIAVVLIAPLQHALFVLAHEAAHYRLYQTRWINDAIGRLVGTITGISMCTYRVIHRLHHNHLYGPQDPDIALHGGYPRGKAYLVKKLAKDLAGLTAFKTYSYFFGAPSLNVATGKAERPLDDTSPRLRIAARRDRWTVLGFHAVAPIVAFANGVGWQYLVLWLLPLVTLLQVILRLRAVCEHGAVLDYSSPLTAARTNVAPLWVRFAIFPHHVNYHVEHHLYPAVPHYNLARLHAALQTHGILDQAEIRNIRDTLGRIFAERRLSPAA